MPLELDIFHPLFNRHLYLIIFEQYVRQNAQQHVLPNYKSIFYHNLHIAILGRCEAVILLSIVLSNWDCAVVFCCIATSTLTILNTSKDEFESLQPYMQSLIIHRLLQAWLRLRCSNLSYSWLSGESCCLKLLVLSKNIKRLGFIHFNLTLNHILDCWIPVTCRLLSPIANNKCNYFLRGNTWVIQ